MKVPLLGDTERDRRPALRNGESSANFPCIRLHDPQLHNSYAQCVLLVLASYVALSFTIIIRAPVRTAHPAYGADS